MGMSGKELATAITDFVNGGDSKDVKEFIDYFCRQHPTLQQLAFGMMLQLMNKMSSDDYRTDGRNEQSKVVAKKLITGFQEQTAKELMEHYSEEKAKKVAKEDYCLPHRYLPLI